MSFESASGVVAPTGEKRHVKYDRVGVQLVPEVRGNRDRLDNGGATTQGVADD